MIYVIRRNGTIICTAAISANVNLLKCNISENYIYQMSNALTANSRQYFNAL